MATPTYTLIDSVTLGSSASSVTFSSIPAGGDLVVVFDGKASADILIYGHLNGDTTTSNYSYVVMEGSGSSAFSYDGNNPYVGKTGTTQSNSIIQINDYSSTDKHKTILGRWNTPTRVAAVATRWANTAAVTSVQLSTGGADTFSAGTTVYLYGIAKAL